MAFLGLGGVGFRTVSIGFRSSQFHSFTQYENTEESSVMLRRTVPGPEVEASRHAEMSAWEMSIKSLSTNGSVFSNQVTLLRSQSAHFLVGDTSSR